MTDLTTTQPRPPRLGAAEGAPAIVLRDVGKTFLIPHNRYSTLKDRVLHPLRPSSDEALEALRGVNLEVAAGEFVGIVGRNGTGKSTLLRCLCGIYRADTGTVDVRGRVAPFIELGVGFNPEMAARDNVIINAVMLGMSAREARARFDEIMRFAELEEFEDLKLMNYSSGMLVRLAFAVTVQVDADVMLFDEVLAVGDAAFQQKCYERFQGMKDAGKTILLVTHDMGLVERFCDRAVLLDGGEVAKVGDPVSVARAYAEMNARAASPPEEAGPPSRGADAAIRTGWVEDAQGRRTTTVEQGETCTACIELVVHSPLDDPVFGVVFRDAAHRRVFATSSHWGHGETGRFAAGDTVVVRVGFTNQLTPGPYTVSASVARGSGALLHEHAAVTTLRVHGPRLTGGVVDLEHDFRVERK